MDDKTCKECYDCKSVFTAWRRKHHCRICGPSGLLIVAYAVASIRFLQVRYFALAVLPMSSKDLGLAMTA